MSRKLLLILLFSAGVALTGCNGGGGGKGGGTTPTPTPTPTPEPTATTTISGKVTVTDTSGKAALKALAGKPRGKPGSHAYEAGKLPVATEKLPAFAARAAVTSASVFLYNSDHPEWLYPVAQSETDSSGNYTLSALANAANNDNGYTDGDAIPKGNYTLMAYKPGGFDPILGVTTDPVVAVQTIVNEFDGAVAGTDLAADPSDVSPTVQSMFGASKNTDGTNTFGNADATSADAVILAPNAAIQVNFSMAMSRGSIKNGVSISPAVDGFWAVSSDWLSATFYLNTGASLTAGQTYTVTVQGENDASPVTNVYGNAVEETAIGYFSISATATADSVAPTAIILSPGQATDVDVITPIRIASNEIMDINGLLLAASPSVGAKPGVMYIGKDASLGQFKYVYEFTLADPLKIGTSYSITVSGGKDLAGNAMNALTYSFATATTSAGIDPNADAVTKSAQADVKDVFGKWVRAMNDYNLAQLQGMMAGNFVMEYDTGRDGVDSADVNADGRYSLKEFSDMITEGFTHWKYCGTTVTGSIPDLINVVGGIADFQFTLAFTPGNNSQECNEGGPENELFAELTNINGQWMISRIGDGIDIRDKTLVIRDVIEQLTPTHGAVITPIPSFTPPNGNPATVSNQVTLSWQPVSNVASYVLVIMNTRDPEFMGRAFALPNTPNAKDANNNDILELKFPFDKDSAGDGILPFGVIGISGKFGFDTSKGIGSAKPGEEFIWEVFGLGTNTTNDFDNDRASNLFRDIVAISKMRRFKNEGTRKELVVGITDGTTPLTFSELYDGYNAGAAGTVTVTVTSPNALASGGDGDVSGLCSMPTGPGGPGMQSSGQIHISGNIQQNYQLNFNAAGTSTCSIQLSQGFNWVHIFDGVDLERGFNVQTTGGIPPVIVITGVKDQNGAALTMDAWGYVNGTGVTSVTLTGSVSLPQGGQPISMVNVNLWNDALQANSFTSVPVSGNAFTVTGLKVYAGDNWIGINDQNWYYSAHMGVHTDTGSTYVKPIDITAVADATMTENYGNSSNWDASLDADDSVTITGKMATPNTSASIHYRFHSQGGYEEGPLNFDANGVFSLTVSLYNGWNGLDLEDGNGAWYGMQIYTSKGKAVPRPTVVSINGTAVEMDPFGMVMLPNGAFLTDQCSVTVVGTSGMGAGSQVHASWNGFDTTTMMPIWDEQRVVTDVNDQFSATLPLLSGNDNFININNEQWVWVGFPVRTTGTCTYTPPIMTVTSVRDGLGNVLDASVDPIQAGISATVTIAGTDNPGRAVVAQAWVCGSSMEYPAVADANGDWSVSVPMYNGWNSLDLTDGPNWQHYNFMSGTSELPPPPPTAVTSLAFYDAADGMGNVLTQSTDPNTPADAMQSWKGCDFQGWMANTAKSVVITGTSTVVSSVGNYFAGSNVGQFNVAADGSFSLTLNLFDGSNNIGLNDANWNHYGLDIQTQNGVQAPQFVFIDSPLDLTTNLSGDITVSGHLATGFAPHDMWANVDVGDPMSGSMFSFYHSNPKGSDKPLSYDSATGMFSFVITGVSSTDRVHIRVESCSGPACHGQEITLNDAMAPSGYHWKGTAGGKARPAIGPAVEQLKNTLKINAR